MLWTLRVRQAVEQTCHVCSICTGARVSLKGITVSHHEPTVAHTGKQAFPRHVSEGEC